MQRHRASHVESERDKNDGEDVSSLGTLFCSAMD